MSAWRELSDDQLAALAKIVQQKLNEYDPSVPFDNYRIVELPDDMFVNQIEDYEEPYEEELFMPTRPKRSQPIDEAVVVIPEDELQDMIEEQEQLDEQPQVIVVPEEMIQEDDEEVPVSDEVLDELELRERIAELATILNERANRGL
ncbi:hypothetical protein Tcan_12235 [Toxocara canis]|uniref:Uncharacterized protein n=1 Tax=Toxocara canis TaxID=6265 RepID=A0A0B2VLL3_TOXCA|nr:hypothetical protein Tcan_12235 [Toxocara canis]